MTRDRCYGGNGGKDAGLARSTRSPDRSARWGVRARSAVAAAVVVSAALLLTSLALLWVLRHSLESAADDAAGARSQQLSTQLLTDPPAEIDRALLATDERTAAVQILVGDQVVLASPGASTTPLGAVRPTAGQRVQIGVVDAPGEVGSYRLTAQGVSGPRGEFTVLVAAVQDPIGATVDRVALLLAVGLPVIVLIVGAATYTLVGRSLRPVERIRARVARITTSDLSERVPVPRSADEIAQLAETMNGMLARLEAGHLAQRRFVGDASHELRSPLATLMAGLELGRTHPELLDRMLISETLLPEAERMQALVDDLLLLARVDEKELPLRITEVDLDDLLQREAARVRAADGITLRPAVHPVRVHADGLQLARAFRNLVDNAVRHARTTVLIGCAHVDDSTARVVIGDDGPGIAAAERNRVFERFVRLDVDRGRSTGGSGLGLAIVAEIIAAHGGSVAVEDSPAGGAQFTVILPTAGPGQPPLPSSR